MINIRVAQLFLVLLTLILAACSPTRDADKHMEFVLAWGSKGTDAGQFLYIEDFAIDANGNLLVTDALRADVQVFDPQGKFLSSFGGSDLFEKPEGIAIAPDGSIF